jgi:hypothetical protein
MVPDRSDRTVPGSVSWPTGRSHPDVRASQRDTAWLTSLAAAGFVLGLFTLVLLVLAALLLPGAA